MKQTWILLLSWIILMSTAFSTTIEDCDPGLAVTTLSRSNIAISWNKGCFHDATSYRVELNVDDQLVCDADEIPCGGESLCQTSIQDINCGRFIKPCYDITMNVIGNGLTKSLTTNLAPLFKSSDWNSSEWNSEPFKFTSTDLVVTWGPPKDPNEDYVSCATNATVSATCIDGTVKDMVADGLNPKNQGNAKLNFLHCAQGDVSVMVTYVSKVTYISEDTQREEYKPTETKKSIPRYNSGASDVYPQNLAISFGVLVIFGFLTFNK